MQRAVIYARYSSERQTEQSIEGQLRVCREFAASRDIVILGEYIDRATTGTNDNRPAFRQMLKDAERREWDCVIVYKGDRFARNRIESALNKKTLRDNGVKLVSATENIPDSPEGIIMESLLEGLAEYYSAELSQKVKRGLNESRHKGHFTGGFLIYGYDIVDKKYTVNPTEAAIVRRVFNEYIGGKTARDIIDKLNREGVTTKQNKPFNLNTVYRMLRNEKYTGVVRFGDEVFTDTVPALITRPQWDIVCQMIESNKRAPAHRRSDTNYILSGKLFCGECGGLMTAEAGTSKTGAVHLYYKCYEKKRHTKPCTMRSVKKSEIENAVFDACLSVLDKGFLSYVIDKAYELHKEDIKANTVIVTLKAAISKKKKALSNIVDAIERGIYNETTQERIKNLEGEVAELQYQLETEQLKAQSALTKDDYRRFLNSFLKKQSDNEHFKAELIELLVRNVVFFGDKIRITFNYTPDGGKGKKRDYEIEPAELEESQAEYRGEPKSSTLFSLVPPKVNNPNPTAFITLEYWGIWITHKRKPRG